MKKGILFLLTLSLLIALVGCNTTKEVPSFYIEYSVDDYLVANAAEGYIDYAYETAHHWDNESKTDTVYITLTIEYEYGYLIAETTYTYQYDRSNDLWYQVQQNPWSEYVDYGEKLIGAEFEGTLRSGATYLIMISSIDFDTNEVIFLYKINGEVTNGQVSMATAYKEHTTFDMDEAEVGTATALTEYGSEVELPLIRMSSGDDGFSFVIFLSLRGIETIGCILS